MDERPRLPVTILLVEDDNLLRTLLCAWLREWAGVSMRCVEVSTLPDAIEALRPGGIDVIILDWRIPGAMGTDAVAALQEAMPADEPPVPIDVVSGDITHDEGLRALAAGADEYLQKDPAGLKPRFVGMVQRSWARHQAYLRLVAKLRGQPTDEL